MAQRVHYMTFSSNMAPKTRQITSPEYLPANNAARFDPTLSGRWLVARWGRDAAWNVGNTDAERGVWFPINVYIEYEIFTQCPRNQKDMRFIRRQRSPGRRQIMRILTSGQKGIPPFDVNVILANQFVTCYLSITINNGLNKKIYRKNKNKLKLTTLLERKSWRGYSCRDLKRLLDG